MTFGKDNWRHRLSNNTQPLKTQKCLFPLWEADVDLPQTDCSIGNDFAFEGLRIILCKAYSSMENYTWNNVLDSHFLMSTCNHNFDLGIHEAIDYQKFLYSCIELNYFVYRCLLHIGNTYICRYYLHNYMNKLEEIEKRTAEIAEEFLSNQSAMNELGGKITALQDLIAEAKLRGIQ